MNSPIHIIKRKLFKYLYKGSYKPGHYYSPVPNLKQIRDRSSRIFNLTENELPGIDLKLPEQKELLETFSMDLNSSLVLNPRPELKLRYYSDNQFFSKFDAFILEQILIMYKPKRITEVGSGFSSAVMMDVNEYRMDNSIKMDFIEPFPDRLKLLMKPSDERWELMESLVQDIPLDYFRSLNENDILFIDSSHVSKVGSDVNHILFNILPVLSSGTIIHFHDILFPFEYPEQWILDGIYWNEAYLLKSFLMYNQQFHIICFNNYFSSSDRQWISEISSLSSVNGGSIWLRKL